MTEWRLFEDGTIPEFTTRKFFAQHPWVDPVHQAGHRQRTVMVAELIREFVPRHQTHSIVDLGCGDGSLLNLIRDLPVAMWGYDAGTENVNKAKSHGLDVRQADFLTDSLEYGELIVATEVVEHLFDPRSFIQGLPGKNLILSSPSAESDKWHYVHHAWAWDLDGYSRLVSECGWTVVRHIECDGGVNYHNGMTRPQRFQAIAAVKE